MEKDFYFQEMDWPMPAFDDLSVDKVVDHEYVAATTTLRYFFLSDALKQQLIDYLPPRSRLFVYNVKLSEVEGQGVLNPHRDHGGGKYAFNWYIRPGGGEARFHRALPGRVPMAYPGKSEACIYQPDDVSLSCAFTARKNSLYLFNIGAIHSVFMPRPARRVFVQFNLVDGVSLEQLL